jgi:hypothetical protein
MESWLPVPVPGLESLYQVSDRGRVYSLRAGKILRPSTSNSGGYPMYMLMVNNRCFPKYAHHLVLEAFDSPRPPGQEARHLDGNASNPALTDSAGKRRLTWGTSSQNKFDEVRHGTHYEASRTHCSNGHEWTKENTGIAYYPDGSFKARRCRECARIKSALQREKRASDERRCKEEGCGKPYFGRGWCSAHYAEWYREQPGVRRRAAASQRRYAARESEKMPDSG